MPCLIAVSLQSFLPFVIASLCYMSCSYLSVIIPLLFEMFIKGECGVNVNALFGGLQLLGGTVLLSDCSSRQEKVRARVVWRNRIVPRRPS